MCACTRAHACLLPSTQPSLSLRRQAAFSPAAHAPIPPPPHTHTHAHRHHSPQATDHILVESHSLLYVLNEYLSKTALLVLPLALTEQAGGGSGGDEELSLVDVPLPLCPIDGGLQGEGWGQEWDGGGVSRSGAGGGGEPLVAAGFTGDGERLEVPLPPGLPAALSTLGLAGSIGCLRMMREPHSARWLPLQVRPSRTACFALCVLVRVGELTRSSAAHAAALKSCRESTHARPHRQLNPRLQVLLGMPLQPQALCTAVCENAAVGNFLDPHSLGAHQVCVCEVQLRGVGR
jgi:hypothetical protein